MTTNKTDYQQGRIIDTVAQNDVAKLLKATETLRSCAKLDEATEHLNGIENSDIEVQDDESDTPNLEPLYTHKPSSVLKKIFVLSLVTLVIAELGLTVYQSFNSSIILGGLYSTLILSALALVSKTFIKEYRQLKKLKSNQLQRTD